MSRVVRLCHAREHKLGLIGLRCEVSASGPTRLALAGESGIRRMRSEKWRTEGNRARSAGLSQTLIKLRTVLPPKLPLAMERTPAPSGDSDPADLCALSRFTLLHPIHPRDLEGTKARIPNTHPRLIRQGLALWRC